METGVGGDNTRTASGLETFLGGMETRRGGPRDLRCVALKPSLVEWKQTLKALKLDELRDLETFLGGMETHQGQPRPADAAPLETFLGGMET